MLFKEGLQERKLMEMNEDITHKRRIKEVKIDINY